MAALSADGKRIEGRVFPDPSPPATTIRFSLDRDGISLIQEVDYDDATGTNRLVRCCIVYVGGTSVVAYEDYDELTALWRGDAAAT